MSPRLHADRLHLLGIMDRLGIEIPEVLQCDTPSCGRRIPREDPALGDGWILVVEPGQAFVWCPDCVDLLRQIDLIGRREAL